MTEDNSRVEVVATLDRDEPSPESPLSGIEDFLPEGEMIVRRGLDGPAPTWSAEMPGDQPGKDDDSDCQGCCQSKSYGERLDE